MKAKIIMEETIDRYPFVTLKRIPSLGYEERLFSDGEWITHQHVCRLECHDACPNCNGENLFACGKSNINMQESRKDEPEQEGIDIVERAKKRLGHRNCVTCGNDQWDSCESCDDVNYPNYI